MLTLNDLSVCLKVCSDLKKRKVSLTYVGYFLTVNLLFLLFSLGVHK